MPQSEDSQYADLDYSGIHQFQIDDIQTGSFEVFWQDANETDSTDPDHDPVLRGWYWWSCFPGCIPDGDPCGPFDTSAEAYHDAQGY